MKDTHTIKIGGKDEWKSFDAMTDEFKQKAEAEREAEGSSQDPPTTSDLTTPNPPIKADEWHTDDFVGILPYLDPARNVDPHNQK